MDAATDRDLKTRYARQMILPEIGLEGQQRLHKARILCIGAGGLGSPALLYLSAAGIGTIGIVDDDVVELSNLQRQIIYTEQDQEKPKAETAAGALGNLNKSCTYHGHHERLDATNVESLFSNYDIIIDGTDNLPSKYLINDAAVKLAKPVIYGSILAFAGQVSVFYPPHGPCYRCLFPKMQDGVQNCAEAGIIGALAGIIGSAQAMEAIKLALGLEFCRAKSMETLIGKFFIYDAKTMHTRILPIARDPACPLCSLPREQIKLTAIKNESCIMIKTIEINDMSNYADWQLVDVREQDEWQQGHMDDALLLPLSQLRDGSADLSQLPKDKNLLLYCQRGRRSLTAGEILQEKGFDVVSLNGGYAAFAENC